MKMAIEGVMKKTVDVEVLYAYGWQKDLRKLDCSFKALASGDVADQHAVVVSLLSRFLADPLKRKPA